MRAYEVITRSLNMLATKQRDAGVIILRNKSHVLAV